MKNKQKVKKQENNIIESFAILGILALLVALLGFLIGVFMRLEAEPTLTPEEDAPWVVMETTTELNVRLGPSKESEVITVLTEGTPIEVQLPSDSLVQERWARVRLGDEMLWVCYAEWGVFYLEEYAP